MLGRTKVEGIQVLAVKFVRSLFAVDASVVNAVDVFQYVLEQGGATVVRCTYPRHVSLTNALDFTLRM